MERKLFNITKKEVSMSRVFCLATLVLAISCGKSDDEMVEFTVGENQIEKRTNYRQKYADCSQPEVDPEEVCGALDIEAQKCQNNFIGILWDYYPDEVKANIMFFRDCIAQADEYYQCVIETISENNMRRECYEDSTITKY